MQDHLHIRGEYAKKRYKLQSKLGSPPHTWRIHQIDLVPTGRNRITSTYVENTDGCELFIRKDKDHLHIRGEYLGLKPNSLPIAGSPPHTWRIRRFTWIQNPTTRITSTYVENTRKTTKKRTSIQDHLHIRGEYSVPNTRLFHGVGSPPHTWRILALSPFCPPCLRITSTYVENTFWFKWNL